MFSSCETFGQANHSNDQKQFVNLAEYTSQWYMPHVTTHQHPTDAHEESHEHIDRIVIKKPETTLDSATRLFALLVRWHL